MESQKTNKLSEILEHLREPFNAWVDAGSKLGGVINEIGGEAQTAEAREAFGRFKVAADEAKGLLRGNDVQGASSSFAAAAEKLVRDVTASIGNTMAADDAKQAFTSAVKTSRGAFEESATAARFSAENRSGEDAATVLKEKIDQVVSQANSLYEKLINKADEADLGSSTGKKAADDGMVMLADDPDLDPEKSDIVDGEVVEEYTDVPGKNNNNLTNDQ